MDLVFHLSHVISGFDNMKKITVFLKHKSLRSHCVVMFSSIRKSGEKPNLKVSSENQILKNNADLLSLQQIPAMVDL